MSPAALKVTVFTVRKTDSRTIKTGFVLYEEKRRVRKVMVDLRAFYRRLRLMSR